MVHSLYLLTHIIEASDRHVKPLIPSKVLRFEWNVCHYEQFLTQADSLTLQAMNATHWFTNAIIYGVNIPAFQDSNGDGFGDLNGLTNRLDYLAELGINCLWLLPFYQSPRR